jgi:hypothetical protein
MSYNKRTIELINIKLDDLINLSNIMTKLNVKSRLLSALAMIIEYSKIESRVRSAITMWDIIDIKCFPIDHEVDYVSRMLGLPDIRKVTSNMKVIEEIKESFGRFSIKDSFIQDCEWMGGYIVVENEEDFKEELINLMNSFDGLSDSELRTMHTDMNEKFLNDTGINPNSRFYNLTNIEINITESMSRVRLDDHIQ